MEWFHGSCVGRYESKMQAEGRPGLASLTGAWSLVQEFCTVFARRPVIDAAVGTNVVVFIAENAGYPRVVPEENVGSDDWFRLIFEVSIKSATNARTPAARIAQKR
jgi:hypothetical protein